MKKNLKKSKKEKLKDFWNNKDAHSKPMTQSFYNLYNVLKEDFYFLEVPRKITHFIGALIPFIYYFANLDKLHALIYLAPVVIIIAGSDLYRILNPKFNKLYLKLLGKTMRPHEVHSFNGSFTFMLGAFLTVLLFPKTIAIVSLLYVTFGDPFACMVGKKLGATKIFNKSLEGSLACFFVCFIIGIWFLKNPAIALISSIVATLAELLPLPINDNFRIPIFSGISLVILFNIFNIPFV